MESALAGITSALEDSPLPEIFATVSKFADPIQPFELPPEVWMIASRSGNAVKTTLQIRRKSPAPVFSTGYTH